MTELEGSGFGGFTNTHSQERHLLITGQAQEYVVDVIGEFRPATTPTERVSQIANYGSALMLTALHSSRGVSSENTELLEAIDGAIAQGQLPDEEGRFGGTLGEIIAAGLPSQHRANPAPVGFEDARVKAFNTGVGIRALGLVAQRFVRHPYTINDNKWAELSVAGKEHVDYDYRYAATQKRAQQALRRILNTHPTTGVALSFHSYDGVFDNPLKFSANTVAHGHTVAVNLNPSHISRQHTNTLQIDLSAESYHVVQRGSVPVVNVDRRSGRFTTLVHEIGQSLFEVMQS